MDEPGVLWEHDDLRRVRALCACAATDNSRPVLCHISVEPEGLVATDSFVLGILSDQQFWLGASDKRLINAKALKRTLTGIARALVSVAVEDGHQVGLKIRQMAMDGSDVVTVIPWAYDGRFLDWVQLVPPGRRDLVEPWFDPAKLKKIGDLRPQPNGLIMPVRIVAFSVMKPARIEAADETLLGVVMPIRWDPEDVNKAKDVSKAKDANKDKEQE